MKALCLTVALSLLPHFLKAEILSDADREALLERLEQMQKDADSKVDARFRVAISAFKSGMASNDAAISLYLKCEEKVNFDDQKRKAADFRDWRRKNSDLLSDSSFRVALRHQLRWLILTLEAASEEPDRDRLAVEAANVLDTIFSKAEDLAPHRNVLEAGVIGSVFARAYDIKGVDLEDWPLSPVQIEAVYDQILLPPLRRIDRISSLRDAWTRRMVHEGEKVKYWTAKSPDGKNLGEDSPAYERFLAETLPELRWKAEIDMFNAGDERAAAMRMLKHIDENITHKSAPKWATEFVDLLQGNAGEAAGEKPSGVDG